MLKNGNFDKTKKSFLGTQDGVLFAKPNVYNTKCVASTPRTVQYIWLCGLKSTFSKKKMLKIANFDKTKKSFLGTQDGVPFAKPND